MRLIDAEAFETEIMKFIPFVGGESGFIRVGKVLELIERVPTIEAKPVVHAHWDEASGGRIICSHCGEYPLYDYWGRIKLSRCCHTCGAQMDEFASDNNVGSKGVKIPVISMEDVPKIMEEKE